ncbi:hypothetical protein Ahy_B04g068959 [Arachis hypogaea]|uniref:Uncharacterized protein n=1 Tax=Arachis hypogaea TaxID=3818 RepID=A0A444ZB90_ARAHY|nr:hypothetical protein Ahy_B04g068959 [Arachis hypogaea]
MEATPNTQQQDDDDIVCLDASFFLNDNYQLTNFTFGSQDIQLFCLQSASRQLVWPGAMLLNDYLSKNVEMLRGFTAIELGSGVGITGILCSRFCHKVVMTDHNEESSIHVPTILVLLLADYLPINWNGGTLIRSMTFYKIIQEVLTFMDSMILIEASKHQMQMKEVPGTRRIVGNLEGVIYEITLGSKH